MKKLLTLAGFLLVTLAPAIASLTPSAQAQLYHWGSYGSSFDTPFPVELPGPTNIVALAASNQSYEVLESGGQVWAGGEDQDGELGNGELNEGNLPPVRVHIPEPVVAIGESEGEHVQVTAGGKVYGEGSNVNSSLCVSGKKLDVPTLLPLSEVVGAAGGEGHLEFLLRDGHVVGCGDNSEGQLGTGNNKSSSTPVEAVGVTTAVEVSAGERQTAVRLADGEVLDWGYNGNGQLGNGTETNSDVPVTVPLPGPASEVYAGGNLVTNGHTVALVAGELIAWGDDEYGQLGDVSLTNKLSPVATGLHFTRVAASGITTIGLTSEGLVETFGDEKGYAVGNGHDKGAILTPTVILSGMSLVSGTATDGLAAG